MWRAVDDLLLRSIADGAFPGCAMAAGQGHRVLFTSVHGKLAPGSHRDVTHTTRYDVGALTQVMATVPLLLHALEAGMLSLDDPISLWLENVPDDKREITVLSLLTQTSGVTPHFLLPDEAPHSRDALNAILSHPLAGSIGGKVRDSAMGYILLGLILEKVFRMPLDEAVKRFVTAPLHMNRTGFLPAGEDIAPAAAESEGEEWQAGQPQDRNARFLHGVAGHAGLFTDLEDAIRFCTMLASDGRTDEGVMFSYRAMHLATTERTRGMNAARGYGFRITKRSDPFLGHLWPSDGYGLKDPASGSLIAVSPEDGFFVTLLLNGHNAPLERLEMERMHKRLLNAAYAAFQHDH